MSWENKFATLAGYSIDGLRSAIGITGRPGEETPAGRSVKYVPLNMSEAKEYIDFCRSGDPVIHKIEQALDSYSLRRGVVFEFMGTELDDEEFGIEDALVRAMRSARMHYHAIGMVAWRNRQTALDNLLVDVEEQVENRVTSDRVGATGPLKRQLERAEELKEALAELADSATNAKLDEVIGDGKAAQDKGDSGTGVSTETERAVIRTLPAVSTMFAPSETLEILPARRSSPMATDDEKKPAQRMTSRTMKEAIRDLSSLEIVDITTGQLYAEVDNGTVLRIVFVNGQKLDGKGEAPSDDTTRNGGVASIDIDRSVTVHVWDKRMPSADGKFVTHMRDVLRARRAIFSADVNAQVTDFMLARPTVMFEQEVASKNAHAVGMLDTTAYGAPEGGVTAEQEGAIREEAVNDFLAAVVTDENNRRRGNALSAAMKRRAASLRDGTADGLDGVDGIGDMSTILLPKGVSVSGTYPRPETRIDVAMTVRRYYIKLFAGYGVPQSMGGNALAAFSGATGSVAMSGGVSAASVVASDADEDRAVSQDREILGDFVERVYDHSHRANDNATVEAFLSNRISETREAVGGAVGRLEELKERMRVVASIASTEERGETARVESAAVSEAAFGESSRIASLNARLEEVMREVRRILQMRFRFRVKFTNPVATPAEVDRLVEIGAIGAFERANIERSRAHLPPITRAEYKRHLKEIDEREKEVLKVAASAVPQQQQQQPAAGAKPAAKAQGEKKPGEAKKPGDEKESADKKKTERKSDTTVSTESKKNDGAASSKDDLKRKSEAEKPDKKKAKK